MSIPKEPRQLMINLMYLVLTALLALNVSAEVMNAFISIDKSLDTTNKNTVKALNATQKSLNDLLKDDSKEKYRPLQPAIQSIRDEVESQQKKRWFVLPNPVTQCNQTRSTRSV